MIYALFGVVFLTSMLFGVNASEAGLRVFPATFTYKSDADGGSGAWNTNTRWTAQYHPSDTGNTDNAYPGGCTGVKDKIIFNDDATITMTGIHGLIDEVTVAEGKKVNWSGSDNIGNITLKVNGELKYSLEGGMLVSASGNGVVTFNSQLAKHSHVDLVLNGMKKTFINNEALSISGVYSPKVEFDGDVEFMDSITTHTQFLVTGDKGTIKAPSGATVAVNLLPSTAIGTHSVKFAGSGWKFAGIANLDVLDLSDIVYVGNNMATGTNGMIVKSSGSGKVEVTGLLDLDVTMGPIDIRVPVITNETVKMTGGKSVQFVKKSVTAKRVEVGTATLNMAGDIHSGTDSLDITVGAGTIKVLDDVTFDAKQRLAFSGVGTMSVANGKTVNMGGSVLASELMISGAKGTVVVKSKMDKLPKLKVEGNLTVDDKDALSKTGTNVNVGEKLVFKKNGAKVGAAVVFAKNKGDIEIMLDGENPAVLFPVSADGIKMTGGTKLHVTASGTPSKDGKKTILFRDEDKGEVLKKLGITATSDIEVPSTWGKVEADSKDVYVTTATVTAKVDFSGNGKKGDEKFEFSKVGKYTITADAHGHPFTLGIPMTETKKWGNNATIKATRKVAASGDVSPMVIDFVVTSLPSADIKETFDITVDSRNYDKKLEITLLKKGSTPNPDEDDNFKNEDLSNLNLIEIPAEESGNFGIGHSGGWKVYEVHDNEDGTQNIGLEFTLKHMSKLTRLSIIGYGFNTKLLQAMPVASGIVGSSVGASETKFRIQTIMKEKDASIQSVCYREKGDDKGSARKVPFYKPILVSSVNGYHPHNHKPGHNDTYTGGPGGCNGGFAGLALTLVALMQYMKKKR